MTVVIEDGTVVTGANSYDSVANIEAFALARGVTLINTEQLIHKAMDWLETQNFQGWKYSASQPLQFPRVGVVIDNYVLPTAQIPTQLKTTEALLVMEIFAGNDPSAPIPQQTKGVKVGPISIDFADGSTPFTITPAVNNSLSKLLGGGDGFEFKVGRDDCGSAGLNYYDDLGWME